MSTQFPCFDDPAAIFQKPICLSPLSKDLKGELKLIETKAHKCQVPPCETLKTVHALKVEVVHHAPCDSQLAHSFDVILAVPRLVTAFEKDGSHRGFHAGDFEWAGAGLIVKGRISGMTNEGTHRLPIKDCQKCNDRGIMEGRLCGQVVSAQDPALKGCQVIAAYRIKFDASIQGGSGAVFGTLEGDIICECKP